MTDSLSIVFSEREGWEQWALRVVVYVVNTRTVLRAYLGYHVRVPDWAWRIPKTTPALAPD